MSVCVFEPRSISHWPSCSGAFPGASLVLPEKTCRIRLREDPGRSGASVAKEASKANQAFLNNLNIGSFRRDRFRDRAVASLPNNFCDIRHRQEQLHGLVGGKAGSSRADRSGARVFRPWHRRSRQKKRSAAVGAEERIGQHEPAISLPLVARSTARRPSRVAGRRDIAAASLPLAR